MEMLAVREEAKAAKVLCAMSGGVDSSLAAALLKDQGFEITGAMLRFWPDERPQGAFDICCSPDAAFDARRVADGLEAPFYALDAREQFAEVVIQPFAPGYQQGRTPNPCVWCNREIKFGAFVKKARMLGCDFVASGHYVRRVDGPEGVELHRGCDHSKDQTYFLWALSREVLPHLLFPLGEKTKAEVRELAREKGLLTADRPSSNGLCFIPHTVKEYLQETTPPRSGTVLDASDGYKQVGEHAGVQFYTVGQRKGLGLYHSHLERFVLELHPEDNVVIVGTREMCRWRHLAAVQTNFLLERGKLPHRIMAQVRYRQSPVPATLELGADGFELHFDEPLFAVAEGQSAVIYEGSRLLGGGVISSRW